MASHLYIDPPLLNSANPWATTLDDLRALYLCPFTGAITTRTCTIQGFDHRDDIHQYTFFDPVTTGAYADGEKNSKADSVSAGSLNTLGYSPLPLAKTLGNLKQLWTEASADPTCRQDKLIFISVTGTAKEVAEACVMVMGLQSTVGFPLAVEVNLSCPNISGKPPPAYSQESLKEYLTTFSNLRFNQAQEARVPIGIKTPPYTDPSRFVALQQALLQSLKEPTHDLPIDFITATNTLGCSLLLSNDVSAPAINSADGNGIGGMAGAPLHPLALGNVRMLRAMLDEREELKGIVVIGVGGVGDNAGFRRMRAVGAHAVGVGTALGRRGVGVFEEILGGGK